MLKTKESVCNGCGAKLDAITSSDGQDYIPEPDSLSICAHCGVISIFENDLSRRSLTSKEIDELPNDIRQQVLHMSNFIKQRRYNLN